MNWLKYYHLTKVLLLLLSCLPFSRGGGDGGEVLRDLPDPGLLQEVQEEEGEGRAARGTRGWQRLRCPGTSMACSY